MLTVEDEGHRIARPVTAAELRLAREHLSLSGERLGDLLGVRDRTVRRWEYGSHLVPDGVPEEVNALIVMTERYVDALVEWVRCNPGRPLVTWWGDGEFLAANPGSALSAAWHRSAVYRVAASVPGGVAVVWGGEADSSQVEVPR